MTLAPLDYLVLGIPLAVVLTISVLMRRYMKSVADFLAANRCAGRYLICSASGELSAAVMTLVAGLETFSRTGFSLGIWYTFTFIISFFLTLFGVVTYRFRETRCLTFHQFLEVRYDRGIRVFASFLNIFSGLINFGLIPAVGGRFFVYFCGLPETVTLFDASVPTYVVVMFILMAISLLMALSGGQISVMITDCMESLISGVFYLVVAFFIVFTISTSQMKQALLSGPPGQSYVDPFDIGARPDFNGWYIIMGLIFGLYIFRGGAWNQGFSAAAKTAHEGKMAGILGSWRGNAWAATTALISLGAFTILHHPAFATQQAQVEQGLRHVHPAQLQTEMRMPLILGLLLAPGVKGAFCAIALFGVLSSQGLQLHGYGSTLLQDVILPLRKKPLSPRAHLIALRLTASFVALFVCLFSMFYTPVDYLLMMTTLIGSIYLAGIGSIVWGGLYWKKGTSAGAWTSMIVGGSFAIAFNCLQEFWVPLHPLFLRLAGTGSWAKYLAAHPDKCPVNGVQFSTGTGLCALAGYVIVSLLTYRKDFDMDRMLHRGRYAVPAENATVAPTGRQPLWARLIGIDEHYSRGDKILAVGTSLWVLACQGLNLGIIFWRLFIGKLSNDWWFHYAMVTGVWIPLGLGIVTTIWFTIGSSRDILELLGKLRTALRNDRDDGTVRDHRNLGDPRPAAGRPAAVSLKT